MKFPNKIYEQRKRNPMHFPNKIMNNENYPNEISNKTMNTTSNYTHSDTLTNKYKWANSYNGGKEQWSIRDCTTQQELPAKLFRFSYIISCHRKTE